jgi:hypothetical protein
MADLKIIQRKTNIIRNNFDSSINLTGYSAKLYLKNDGANGFSINKDSSITFDASTMKGLLITTLSAIDSSLKYGECQGEYVFDNSTYKFSDGIFTIDIKPSLT